MYNVKSLGKENITNSEVITNMESTSVKLKVEEPDESELLLYSNVLVQELTNKSKPVTIFKSEHDTKTQDQSTLCTICKRRYKSKASLGHHLRVKHGFINRSRMKMPCLEPDCNFKCNRIARLITHLIQVHEKKFECETVTFANKEDFWKWKDEAEKRCKSSYTTHTSPKKSVGGNEKYFFQCRRSGFTKNKKATDSSEERLSAKFTKRESIKINGACTSFMKVIFEKEEKAIVHFCRTHYGHPEDAKHLRMNDKEKLMIEALIIQGLTAAQIISIMKTKIPPERHQLLKYSNIRNISQKKNLFLARRLYTLPRKLPRDEFILAGLQPRSDESSLHLLVDNEVEVQEHILDASFQDSYNSTYKIEMHSKADTLEHQLQHREMESLRNEIQSKIERLANLSNGFNSIASLKLLNSDLDAFIEKVDADKDIELIRVEDLSADNEVIPIGSKNIAFSKDDDGNTVTIVCYN